VSLKIKLENKKATVPSKMQFEGGFFCGKISWILTVVPCFVSVVQWVFI
jgi:hypothetical protein